MLSCTISLKGAKNEPNSLRSLDFSHFPNVVVTDNEGIERYEFLSLKLDGPELDDGEDDAYENFFRQIGQAQFHVAHWIALQDQEKLKLICQSGLVQLVIQESGEGRQFDISFFSEFILNLGMAGISLIYQYDDIEEISNNVPMHGALGATLRAYKDETIILFEDFLSHLELKNSLISIVTKSKRAGAPVLVDFQNIDDDFSDQIFFEYFSKIALWLGQQNNQPFLDLEENKAVTDFFIGGHLDGSRYRFAFPANFLLECGVKRLKMQIYIND